MGKKITTIERILVVDDDNTSNFVTNWILKEYNPNIVIEVFNNPEDIIQVMHNFNTDEPNILLLDINMPKMNGIDFLDWYHDNGHQGKMNIFMYSTSVREKDKSLVSTYQDVIGYIEKPLDENKIKELITLVNQR